MQKAQKSPKQIKYDEHAKKLLSHKIVLANILVGSVEEFRGKSPEKVAEMIEADIRVSSERVNAFGVDLNDMVMGYNTEDSSPDEGTIRFDIKFTVKHPTITGTEKILVDIEAQYKFPTDYNIGNRISYYGGRMIASQKNVEFTNSDYNNVKKAYSIWICMNCPSGIENTITAYPRTQKCIVGTAENLPGIGLFTPIVIGLSSEILPKDESTKLLRLLELFFLPKKTSNEEKKTILESEYNIEFTEDIERSMMEMCNLSQGLVEEGEAKGADFMGMAMTMLYNKECSSVEELIARNIPENIAKKAMTYFPKVAVC